MAGYAISNMPKSGGLFNFSQWSETDDKTFENAIKCFTSFTGFTQNWTQKEHGMVTSKGDGGTNFRPTYAEFKGVSLSMVLKGTMVKNSYGLA